MRQLRLWLRRHDNNDGFGLIEMVIALLIAGMVFGALATVLVATVRTSLLSRQNQQAADYMTQAIEQMRLQDFGSLSVSSSAYAGDPNVAACGGTGLLVNLNCEPLVTPPATASVPGVQAVQTLVNASTNRTTYTIRRYVTVPNGSASTRVVRVTATVQWTLNNSVHMRSTSTMIAYSQRGLPLPLFDVTPGTSAVGISTGAQAIHAFKLTNKGAPDRWNVVVSGPGSGSFGLYADSNSDGAFSPATDSLLGDTSGDGIADTGRIDPGSSFTFFLATFAGSPLLAGNYATTVTLTSVGQPAATGASVAVVAQTMVVDPSGPVPTPSTTSPAPAPSASVQPETTCVATGTAVVPSTQNHYTLRTFGLHNAATQDSTTIAQMGMSTTASAVYPSNGPVTWPGVGQYSTDVAATTGRTVSPAPAATTSTTVLALSDVRTYADWEVQFTQKTDLRGDTRVRIWVAAPSGPVTGGTLSALLYQADAAGTTRTIEGFVTGVAVPPGPPGCAGFQEVSFLLPIPSTNDFVPASGKLHLRLTVSSASALRLGYDATTMPAGIVVGVKP